MYELKQIDRESIPAALEKANFYRLLNEPVNAESISRDVLAVDPENQRALIMLIMSLADQFDDGLSRRFQEARELAGRIQDDYQRAYFSGVVCERRAKAQYKTGIRPAGSIAYEWLTKALEFYQTAEPLRPEDNDEVILRWNACVRIIERHPTIQPAHKQQAGIPEMLE